MSYLRPFVKAAGLVSAGIVGACLLSGKVVSAAGQDAQPVKNSYLPVDDKESFATVHGRMAAAKAGIMKRQMDLLEERYDLSDHPASGVVMDRTKPVQEGVRVKLSRGVTWAELSKETPDQIRDKGDFPQGFLPLPHANHPEGGMVFPNSEIQEVLKQESRDLTRFDLDFDIPDRFLAEFPAAMYLTTRPDLGDVSQGQLVTVNNYYELFSGILNPKQLEGLRLLLTPFPQQQFNETIDRRSEKPSRGVACLDCHTNGGTNGAFHLVGDIRPQEFRHRIETPALRGVNIQRLFGSQRALKTVEDFTEFEQRAAYFDGDPVIATKKGVNVLERGSQVHFMSEFEEIMDFPPAPKLGWDGKLGSQRALKTVEDFTEFEQRAAYFDGDPVIATKKGVNVLERGSQVHDMAELQEIMDFPPAPKLGWNGKLDPAKATPAELHGQEIFFGKGQCASCHSGPYFTDNTM